VLAKELTGLSMHEREQALFDLHGIVADNEPTTDDEIDGKIRELQICLSQLLDRSAAFDFAEKEWYDYIHNRKFLISFLRADGWDPMLASKRLNLHFQVKGDLFGMEKLGRDITQDDLDPEAKEVLYSGLMQYLPLRDRAGRLIHVSFYHPDSISLHSKLQRGFYTSMVSNEDTETQRKGRVAIGYLAGQGVTTRPRNDWQVGKLLQALPVRIQAVHLCHDIPSLWRPVFAAFKYVVTLFMRMRLREHFGSHEECRLILQTFGIPNDIFPLVPNDKGILEIVTDYHVSFWQKRANWERLLRQQQCPRDLSGFGRMPSPALSSEIVMEEEDYNENADPDLCSDASVTTTSVGQELILPAAAAAVAAAAKVVGTSYGAPPGAATGTTLPTTQALAPPPPLVFLPSTSTRSDSRFPASPPTAATADGQFLLKKIPHPPPAQQLQLQIQHHPIIVPAQNDVLLGRGKGYYQHLGNIRFRTVIESRRDDYDASSSGGQKRDISNQIIDAIHGMGGRFLKDDATFGWILADREVARQKVAHCFRALRVEPGNNSTNTNTNTKERVKKCSANIRDDTNDGLALAVGNIGTCKNDLAVANKRIRR
jgi:hypothetical protein